MWNYLSLFLVITLTSFVFGFVGTSGSIEGIAQIVFALFAGILSLLIIFMRYEPVVAPL